MPNGGLRLRGFIPVMGAYHWDIGEYGKVSNELIYQKEAMQAVFQEILQTKLVPPGFFRDYVKDNIKWLADQPLETCDAGRYSIVIDSAGNVSSCLARPSVGNLLEFSLSELLAKFDHPGIKACSDQSSCNMLCSRVVGKTLRHPLAGMTTLLPTLKG